MALEGVVVLLDEEWYCCCWEEWQEDVEALLVTVLFLDKFVQELSFSLSWGE